MSSLLTTAVDESCQSNTLRGRRRSSVHPLSTVPRLFLSTHPTSTHQPYSDSPDESALSDEIELVSRTTSVFPENGSKARATLLSRPTVSTTEISPLLHAHVSDYAPKMIVPRHQDSIGSSIECSVPSTSISPQSSNPTSTVNSRRGSYENLLFNSPVLRRDDGERRETFERMKWRLAAGYFAFFMCGWGDGSE